MRRLAPISFLICFAPPETMTILRELLEVYADFHEAARSIVRKYLNQGYYWLTMGQEVAEMVHK